MDIPSYIALVRAERLDDAYKVLLKTNPFPAVCGRVCDHKCQSKCRRGSADGAVSIKYLKRFITDNAIRPSVSPVAVTRKEKIAVIGAGPAGLTAARELAKRGYKVVVFESRSEAGGWMRWGIPEYRLPRDILAEEISDIAEIGVEIRTGTAVGRDISFKEIGEDFDYVFLAVGAQQSSKMNVRGEDLDGVFGGIEFLSDFNADPDAWLDGRKALGGRVAVIGGGNTAIDAARTAIRLGADVTIYYRRERKDMPAQEAEITAAEREGVKIDYMVAPLEILSDDNRVRAIKLQKMMPGDFDASGRRRPVPGKGGVFTVDIDTVVVAVGQAADTTFLADDTGVKINKWSYLQTVGGLSTATGNDRFFAGGDAVTGPGTVIEAIAAGHRAACEIDEAARRAKGEPPYEPPPEEDIEIPFIIDEEDEDRPPAAMPELDVEIRRRIFAEVELGYKAETAFREATRCLRCDVEL
jgi:NADH-quinone oxidoreductase subunit F